MKSPIIESGVPMPASRTRSDAMPFGDMEVGDSIFFSGATQGQAASRALSWKRRAKSKFVFSTRVVDGGVRVWRIK